MVYITNKMITSKAINLRSDQLPHRLPVKIVLVLWVLSIIEYVVFLDGLYQKVTDFG